MRWVLGFFTLVLIGALGGVGVVLYGFYHFGRGLPDYGYLADYEPPVVTRVHAGDGRLLEEFATKKRVFIPIDSIPRVIVKAFLAAEDKNFYSHPGVDLVSLASAVVLNIKNYGSGRRPVGASTITQQVAKNFLLTNEVSIERKAKEAILAIRVERVLSKDRILELYLNEIYLGFRSYGVAAAALNYFDKPLNDLTLAEAAYLAALPKGPNNYHPARKKEAALIRRNWVIGQMVKNGFVSASDGEAAKQEDLIVRTPSKSDVAQAEYFVEEVRREIIDQFGEKGLYEGGFSVRTTIDSRLQRIADEVLKQGLEVYDRRHGWRGPVATLEVKAGWGEALAKIEPPKGTENWRLALVLKVDDENARIGFADGSLANLPYAEMKWARAWLKDQRFGAVPKTVGEVLSPGEVVLVEPVSQDAEGRGYPAGTYALRQVPDVSGGLLALDPHTGRVLAMSGGYDHEMSEFNRATQALRQPGASFKPFVYLAALDEGYTPATKILDAPFVIDQGAGLGKWKPANYSKIFYGPTPMRIGIEKSRNLMTVRLAQTIGMERVIDYAKRFGIVEDMEPHLSYSLGAKETTLKAMTAAYGMLVNGGKQITPTLLDRIVDRNGRTLFKHDKRPCRGCRAEQWDGGPPPSIPDQRKQLVDPASAYQTVSIMSGVVTRGTGRRIATLKRPLAGKTGTTNNNTDAWFVGFSPDLAVGVYIGFDRPRTLGKRDTASSVAVPVFKDFMEQALADTPKIDFRIPPGVRLVWTDHATGQLANQGDRGAILEAFKPGTEPTGSSAQVLDGGVPGLQPSNSIVPGSGQAAPVASGGSGLY